MDIEKIVDQICLERYDEPAEPALRAAVKDMVRGIATRAIELAQIAPKTETAPTSGAVQTED